MSTSSFAATVTVVSNFSLAGRYSCRALTEHGENDKDTRTKFSTVYSLIDLILSTTADWTMPGRFKMLEDFRRRIGLACDSPNIVIEIWVRFVYKYYIKFTLSNLARLLDHNRTQFRKAQA